jgi:hypothetical protein
MRNDDVLLNEAYAQVYNEGILDRLKGQAAGIGSGLKQGVQNIAGKIAGAAGADVKTSGKTMGGAYANAQQTSLLNSFIKKAQKELNDFVNDMSKMGANNIEDVKKTHPQIAQQMQQVNGVIEYLKQSAAGQKPQGDTQAQPQGGNQAQLPAPKVDSQLQDQGNTATPVSGDQSQDDQSQGDQSQAANFNADVAGKPPAVQQSKSVVPNEVQRSKTPGGTMNVSSSIVTQPKQVNQLPTDEPVQKVPSVSGALKDQGIQDAEVVGGEETQKESPTQGYADVLGQQDGKKPEAYQSTTPAGQSVQASENDLKGSGAIQKKPYAKKEDGWYIGATKVGDQKAKILDDLWKKQNKGTQQSSSTSTGNNSDWKQTGAGKVTKTYK